jgi:hypothetical protein
MGVLMPRIKRWFPVSHDINRDPELWDLCAKFGDKALRCWLELLSIADRNDGLIPGNLENVSRAVAWAIRCKTTKTLQIINEITTLGWLNIDEGINVVNYAKYHITRDVVSVPSEPSLPDRPKERNKNYEEPASPEPTAGFKSPNKIDPEIKAAADPVYNSDPVKFARLIVWIKQAEKAKYSKPAIVKSLRDFLPYAASVNGEWWAYLDKLIYKAEPNLNSRQFEKEHEQRKKAEADIPPHVAQALKGVH